MYGLPTRQSVTDRRTDIIIATADHTACSTIGYKNWLVASLLHRTQPKQKINEKQTNDRKLLDSKCTYKYVGQYLFFGFRKCSSVTAMLFELGLPSFATIIITIIGIPPTDNGLCTVIRWLLIYMYVDSVVFALKHLRRCCTFRLLVFLVFYL